MLIRLQFRQLITIMFLGYRGGLQGEVPGWNCYSDAVPVTAPAPCTYRSDTPARRLDLRRGCLLHRLASTHQGVNQVYFNHTHKNTIFR
jgi:hypothetical protein